VCYGKKKGLPSGAGQDCPDQKMDASLSSEAVNQPSLSPGDDRI
jgi:hypothetical protein